MAAAFSTPEGKNLASKLQDLTMSDAQLASSTEKTKELVYKHVTVEGTAVRQGSVKRDVQKLLVDGIGEVKAEINKRERMVESLKSSVESVDEKLSELRSAAAEVAGATAALRDAEQSVKEAHFRLNDALARLQQLVPAATSAPTDAAHDD